MIKKIITAIKEGRELANKMPKFNIREATPVEAIYEKIARTEETYENKLNAFIEQCQKKGLTPTADEREFAKAIFSI